MFNSHNNRIFQSDEISSLCEDSSSNLWVGTRYSGVIRYALRSHEKSFSHFDTINGLPNNTVLSLLCDKYNNLWVGTEKGLSIIPQGDIQNSKKFVNYIFRDSLAHLPVPVLSLSNRFDNEVVVATEISLVKIPLEKNPVIQETKLIGGVFSAKLSRFISIQTAMVDSKNNVWIGSREVINIIHTDNTVTCSFFPNTFSSEIRTILEDNDGNVWIGTFGQGLFQWDNNTLNTYATNNPFPAERILSLLQDREGSIWVGTRGLGLLRIRKNFIATLSRENGLTDNYLKRCPISANSCKSNRNVSPFRL